MSIEAVLNTLLHLDRIKCNRCGAAMIIQKNGETIIKNRLMVISKNKGAIEIKCRECGYVNQYVSN